MLNTVYKIFVKANSISLQVILPTVTHQAQTIFIRERIILDNAYTFWEFAANKNTSRLKERDIENS